MRSSLRGVHVFYYLWYGTPDVDGNWSHWNHAVLPHWDAHVQRSYAQSRQHNPPDLLHSPFYPERGCYSSRDPEVLAAHMREIRAAGADTAVLSWTGREGGATSDTQGVYTDTATGAAIAAAIDAGVNVAFHLEPYPGRSVSTIREDLEYIFAKHLSQQRALSGQVWFYVYDSCHIHDSEWERLLTPEGDLTVRNGSFDGVFLGLMLGRAQGLAHLRHGGFDGVYTYFAADRFSEGSDMAAWGRISEEVHALGKLFVPGVGPGYDDTRIRPWNRVNLRPRQDGAYYERAWNLALAADADVVSVTSFNEWGEGTQIEAAVPHTSAGGVRSEDYSPHDPGFYLRETARFAEAYWHAVRRIDIDSDAVSGMHASASRSNPVAGADSGSQDSLPRADGLNLDHRTELGELPGSPEEQAGCQASVEQGATVS